MSIGRHRTARTARIALGAALGSLVLGAAPTAAQASAPQIATAGASATGPTAAEVNGAGSADGPPTTMHVDYAQASEAWCATGGTEGTPQQTAPESLGEGHAMISEIVILLSGLAPDSEYCAELVAENDEGVSHGGQVRFATLPVPTVVGESVANVTATDAMLEAEIDLHGIATGAYYQFQLVEQPGEYVSEIVCPAESPGFSVCIGTPASGALPISYLPGNTLKPSAFSRASLDLASAGMSLQPGTTYHYRVLVARRVPTEDTLQWEPPIAYGADRTFTTPGAGSGTGGGDSAGTTAGSGTSGSIQGAPVPARLSVVGSQRGRHGAKRHSHRRHRRHRKHHSARKPSRGQLRTGRGKHRH
jgi:hypothetical protein